MGLVTKIVLSSSLGIFLFNRAVTPFLTSRVDETIFNPKIQECMNTEKYIHNFSGKDNSDVSLKYLKHQGKDLYEFWGTYNVYQ